MNYSSIFDAYNNDNDIDINYIIEDNNDENDENNKIVSAIKLLNDYKKIKKTLENDKILLDDLNKRNEILSKYAANIYISYIDIMMNFSNETTKDEILKTNEMETYILKYNELFKEYYNNWASTYYEITKKKLIEKIEKQENILFGYRKLFINTTNEIIKIDKETKNLCPICFENEINMCAIPCGHTCCNTCIIKNLKYNNDKCLNCRNNLKEYIKLYIQI